MSCLASGQNGNQEPSCAARGMRGDPAGWARLCLPILLSYNFLMNRCRGKGYILPFLCSLPFPPTRAANSGPCPESLSHHGSTAQNPGAWGVRLALLSHF